jgi:hypothetical protein
LTRRSSAPNAAKVGGRSTSSSKVARASSVRPSINRLATERNGTSSAAQGLRRVGLGVAQQLPRDAGGFLHACHHFDPRVVQAVAQPRPQITGIAAGLEHGLEQRHADLGHARLDPGRDLPLRLEGDLQEVLEVPAQVAPAPLREREGERRGDRLADDLRAGQLDLDPVLVRPDRRLRKA